MSNTLTRKALEAAETMLRCLPDTTTNAGGTRPNMTTAGALSLVREAIAQMAAVFDGPPYKDHSAEECAAFANRLTGDVRGLLTFSEQLSICHHYQKLFAARRPKRKAQSTKVAINPAAAWPFPKEKA